MKTRLSCRARLIAPSKLYIQNSLLYFIFLFFDWHALEKLDLFRSVVSPRWIDLAITTPAIVSADFVLVRLKMAASAGSTPAGMGTSWRIQHSKVPSTSTLYYPNRIQEAWCVSGGLLFPTIFIFLSEAPVGSLSGRKRPPVFFFLPLLSLYPRSTENSFLWHANHLKYRGRNRM